MKTLLIFILFFSHSLFAACKFTIEKSDITVNWTAFKTPKKVGVNGFFRDLGIKETKTADSLEHILVGETFSIDATSVRTRNAQRDAKIVKFFFSKLKGGMTINGKINKFSEDEMELDLTMNSINKKIPLSVVIKEKQIQANGVIDILDFQMLGALKNINQACSTLHEGKTWSDVNIELKVDFNKSC